jgi:uncharacterized protein (TIGR02246 family)
MCTRSRSGLLFLCLLALPISSAFAQGKTVLKADREAEEQRIRQLDRQWVAAVSKKDAVSIVQFYAAEARIMPANAPTARGRAAIAEFWRGFLELPGLDFSFEPQVIKVAEAGDLAYDVGTYSLSHGAAQARVQDRGKYLVVWEKVGGEWKAMVDTFNSDLPAR